MPEVRLVGENGEQLGIQTVRLALETAKKRSLDLVEVAPTAEPPVCRLMDYGKYKYQQAKKESEAKRGQHVTALREVRLRPKIGIHDFDAKSRSARKLLENGDKVKITILFRGREITHPELGFKLLQRMADLLKEVAVIDRQPSMENRRMMLILAPMSTARKVRAETTVAAPQNVPQTKAPKAPVMVADTVAEKPTAAETAAPEPPAAAANAKVATANAPEKNTKEAKPAAPAKKTKEATPAATVKKVKEPAPAAAAKTAKAPAAKSATKTTKAPEVA